MANREYLILLQQGMDGWNAWRKQNPAIMPDLSGCALIGENLIGANLSKVNLHGANLSSANLHQADLRGANLSQVNLSRANLSNADLTLAVVSEANLEHTNFRGANLRRAHLRRSSLHQAILLDAELNVANLREADASGADLRRANLSASVLSEANFHGANLQRANLTATRFRRVNLSEADLTRATLLETVFVDTNMADAKGLDHCIHLGASTIDHRTLSRSGALPSAFLRGVGLPNKLIDFLPTFLRESPRYDLCAISYSESDREFAQRLQADLQAAGVRSWLIPEQLKQDVRYANAVSESIRLRDKVLLICSATSIESPWIAAEVRKVLETEKVQSKRILLPLYIDDTALKTEKPWTVALSNGRPTIDFSQRQNKNTYENIFCCLLRALEQGPESLLPPL
ncbi:MAG: toll/interleukin-1 receptor domain-containing protein [Gammaproteobacteria bacterium]|nr:toll/interleukin-1 receptor domain-containing protein [Gammaproteobacteria bacterium]